MSRLILVLPLLAVLPANAIEVRVADATVPPGALVQLQIGLTDPQPIITGRMGLSLDSVAFGSVEGIALFSPQGDVAGAAVVRGNAITTNFTSPKQTFGTTLDYPIMTIATVTNPGTPVGTKTQVVVDLGSSFWQDLLGVNYPATVKPGTITAGGTLSVFNIVPGGGPLPAGYVVRLLGTGFLPTTTVLIDGTTQPAVHYVNATEIDLTLAEAVDLTSKRVRVQNGSTALVTYFSYLRAVPQGTSSHSLLNITVPIFQQITQTVGYLPAVSTGIAALGLLNSSLTPVDVGLDLVNSGGGTVAHATMTVQSGNRWVREIGEIFGGAAVPAGGGVRATAGTAIQMIGLNADEVAGTVLPLVLGTGPAVTPQLTSPASGGLTFNYTIGGTLPGSQTANVGSTGAAISYTSAATPVGSWLGVSPPNGTTPSTITVSVNPAGLAAGTYNGTVTLTGGAAPLGIPVVLNVSPAVVAPVLTVTPAGMQFTGPGPQPVNVGSTSTALTYTVTKSDPWIVVSSPGGTTPGTFTIDVSVAGLTAGVYTGKVTVAATGSSKDVNVTLTIAAAGCVFTLNRGGNAAPAAGDIGRVEVATGAGCAWAGSSGVDWITMGTPVFGGGGTSGAGFVRYTVAGNGGAARSGTLTVGGQTFTVTQVAAGCVFGVSPTSLGVGAGGGSSAITVTGTAGCVFTASASDNWLTFPNGASGASGGSVTVAAGVNGGALPRTGSVSIGGQLVQVSQKPGSPGQVFDDVPVSHPYWDQITLLKTNGITVGCSATTYCPDATTTRGQMAVFIIRALMGGDSFAFNPTASFTDVGVGHPYFKYIQKMKELGITVGCSATTYCPDDPVTRGQMAVFLIRGRLGVAAGQSFPYTGTGYFDDVPGSHPYFGYIQKLRELGITVGCSATSYCPDAPNTRGQMAVFVIRAFFTE